MAEQVPTFRISIFAMACAVLIGCSSTTSTSRYKKPSENEKPHGSSLRFTSDEEFDVPPPTEADLDNKEISRRFQIENANSAAISPSEKMLIKILKFVNTPYQFGGESKAGIDCSAFTQTIFFDAAGIDLPRTAALQFKSGKKVSDKSHLKFGDLLFFNTTKRAFPGHVGIYIGDDLFAHASSSKGVTVSNFRSSYYKSRYVGARRFLNNQ